MSAYVVPGRRVLTVVHLRDPQRKPIRRLVRDVPWWGTPDLRLGQREPIRVAEYTAASDDGATLCGLAMLIDEEWIGWTLQPDDHVCPGCVGGVVDRQETLL